MPDPHPSDLLPPANVGSPTEAPWLDEPGIPFWTPSWRDAWKYLGWRWLLLLPAAGCVAILLLFPVYPGYLQFLWLGGKLTIMALAVPFGLAAYAVRAAVQARKDPFCIHCGYGLTGLPDGHRCPECGRPFSLRLIEEYRRDPHWFIQRCKARSSHPTTVPFAAGAVRSKRKSRDGT